MLLQVSLLRETTTAAATCYRPHAGGRVPRAAARPYGLHIDQLPDGDGFTGAHLDDQAALRANSAAFLNRLREIGYYQDMSDAYLTQTITPRYTIGTAARTGATA